MVCGEILGGNDFRVGTITHMIMPRFYITDKSFLYRVAKITIPKMPATREQSPIITLHNLITTNHPTQQISPIAKI